MWTLGEGEIMDNNPYGGSVSYLNCLVGKIKGVQGSRLRPHTGGAQHSIRINSFTWDQIGAISDMSGWSRSEVVTAMIERGMYDFHKIGGKKISAEVLGKIKAPLNQDVVVD